MFENLVSLSFCLHFAVLPAVLFLVMREVFRRTHKVSADDEVVLAQRFTRACVAVTLVFGGIKVRPQMSCATSLTCSQTLVTIPGFAYGMRNVHPAAVYWLEGTAVFYVLDCVLLAFYGQWNVSMWIHHFCAVVLFVSSLAAGSSYSGCVYALLAEALVPWGFLLFYLRAVQWTESTLFQVRAAPHLRRVAWG